MKKNRTFKCKYCNRKFDSEQALASHLRVHKKKKERVKVKREDDPPEDDPKPQPKAVPKDDPPQPQPVPQSIPPSPNDYFFPNQPRVIQNQQVQAQQQETQNNKKYGPVEILFGLLSTPTVVEAIKTYLVKNNSDGGEDPIKQLAFQQMIDAWRFEHEMGKRYSETPIEMTKFMLQNMMKGKKQVIMLPMPIPPREDNEKEKKLIGALVELNKKLDNITDKINELLDEEEEEEDGEFV